MITYIAKHWIYPEKLEEAKAAFAEWGRVAHNFPGLIFRQVVQSETDPLKITTITTWGAHEDNEGWHKSPERAIATVDGRGLWHKVESEFYEVLRSGRRDPLPEL